MGENQVKFEAYIKKFIQTQNLALYHGSGCMEQKWIFNQLKRGAELENVNP
jgi:hypothetical protein